MSSDGHYSDDTLLVEALVKPRSLQTKPYLGHSIPQDIDSRRTPRQRQECQEVQKPSSTRTSEDTLLNNSRPSKSQKTKKAPRHANQQSDQNKDKLCERICRMFADQLSGGAKYVSSSDILRNVLTPQKTIAQLGVPKISDSESTLIAITQKDPTFETTTRLDRPSSTTSKMCAKYRTPGKVFCLDEMSAFSQVETLVERFGKVSHMGVLDSSYSLFLTESRVSGLLFKVYDGVAVVSGDPLCEWHQIENVLAEFAAYRKKFGLDIVFMGATAEFVELAKSRKWVTMQFGVEKVLNPMTNPLLLETGAAKRTISNSKQLLKKNMTLGIYIPKHGADSVLQDQLMDVYNDWCSDRNNKPIVQAYVTVLDPLAMPGLMTYIYAKDANGIPCGFAALRKIVNGYHIDPCVARPGAPRGVTELLIIAAMSLLHAVGIPYLSLGYDPSPELGEISGVPKIALGVTRSIHKRSVAGLPVNGKRAFYDKFRPDEHSENAMHVIIPTRGLPKVKHFKAMMHIVNIDISKLLREEIKKSFGPKPDGVVAEQKADEASEQIPG